MKKIISDNNPKKFPKKNNNPKNIFVKNIRIINWEPLKTIGEIDAAYFKLNLRNLRWSTQLYVR